MTSLRLQDLKINQWRPPQAFVGRGGWTETQLGGTAVSVVTSPISGQSEPTKSR